MMGDFRPIHHPPIFELVQISLKDIAAAIDKIINTQSSSLDGITSYMLKSGMTELLGHLQFQSMSIRQSKFPEQWKITELTSLHKQGPTDDMNNYRPNSG